MDAGNKFKTGRVGDENHVVLPSASGLIYWSNTFAINNFIDLSKVKFLQRLTKNVSGAQRTDEAFGSLRLKVGLTFGPKDKKLCRIIIMEHGMDIM